MRRATYDSCMFVGLLTLLLWPAGCATVGTATDPATSPEPAPIEDLAPNPGLPTVLVAMPNTREFADVRRGLVTEIHRSFNVSTFVVRPQTTADEFGQAIDKAKPACTVLMNNATVGLYRQIEAARAGAKLPPAVVVMASFLEELRAKLHNATGIAYEVPGVTAFVHLRDVITRPVHRVGVLYRPVFKPFIERQKALAAREQVELVATEVASDVSADQVRAALRGLAEAGKVDAVWMLNDNGLIRDAAFLDESWRTELRSLKLPLIVGVSNLVDPASPLGTLAVVPDNEALGLQTANLVLDLADNDWQAAERSVELPLSVKTVVDVKQVREDFGLRPDALTRIDRPLE